MTARCDDQNGGVRKSKKDAPVNSSETSEKVSSPDEAYSPEKAVPNGKTPHDSTKDLPSEAAQEFAAEPTESASTENSNAASPTDHAPAGNNSVTSPTDHAPTDGISVGGQTRAGKRSVNSATGFEKTPAALSGLGAKIKRARIDAHMNQSELAGGSVTRNMISQIETGAALPSLTTLCVIAERLGVPAGVLLGDPEDYRQYRTARELHSMLLKKRCQSIGERAADMLDGAKKVVDPYMSIVLSKYCAEKSVELFNDGNLAEAKKLAQRAVELSGGAGTSSEFNAAKTSGDTVSSSAFTPAKISGDAGSSSALSSTKLSGDVRSSSALNASKISGEAATGSVLRTSAFPDVEGTGSALSAGLTLELIEMMERNAGRVSDESPEKVSERGGRLREAVFGRNETSVYLLARNALDIPAAEVRSAAAEDAEELIARFASLIDNLRDGFYKQHILAKFDMLRSDYLGAKAKLVRIDDNSEKLPPSLSFDVLTDLEQCCKCCGDFENAYKYSVRKLALVQRIRL